ncbi:hypothetical protein PTTG_28125 [Puccinia triticina 1-1 BBBD Race 1]|uniref:Uncharacterized protein n=2 Tax=Puccinia triticina TaxID=208348 RepID=A0A180GED1_PUCT1|nr:uncharacterized protein PtA15_4A569 [Puccinia triticina]OAV91015.1 hypothetical protein PTTG_28125 [Puccinia triticina 1-1 BBBD Race 1]WAQ84118.1 hypothetical protein PtA15_4A569 [Puccinia triticina]
MTPGGGVTPYDEFGDTRWPPSDGFQQCSSTTSDCHFSDWILINELHDSLLARFNNKAFSGPGRPISLAYLQLIFQDYMKLNKPLSAQKELLLSFNPLCDHHLHFLVYRCL